MTLKHFKEEVATQIIKNCRRRQPHCHLTPPPREPREYPHSLRLIFPETRVTGLYFAVHILGQRLAVDVSQKCEVAQNSVKI